MPGKRVPTFVIVASIHAVLVGGVVAAAWCLVRSLGAVGTAFGEVFVSAFLAALRWGLPFAPDRPADLSIAPGAPGHLASLGTGGQLHFHDAERGVTQVAVEAWGAAAAKMLIVVAEYDGAPRGDVAPGLLRRSPVLSMVALRVGDDVDVWWSDAAGEERGPARAVAGAMNLWVLPGKVALRCGDGVRGEIEVGWPETVFLTLGPEGLATDAREGR